MPESEHEQADLAAAEAAAIGGTPSTEEGVEHEDPAQQPLTEAGQGEAEGFEEAERQLADHASHGDQHASRRAIEDAPGSDQADDARAAAAGETDEERSSELEADRP